MITKAVKRFTLQLFAVIVAIAGVLITPAFVEAQNAYNSGTYGSCDYNSCGLTMGADATANINVTPAAGATRCSVANAEVQVLTDSSTGYTLSMTDADTSAVLTNGSTGTINTSSGTSGTPAALTANTWGYRVDGINGFGTGPTSTVSSGAIPSLNFAAIPVSSATPDVIATQSTPANPYVSTYVWYGVCVDATIPNGAYTDSVTYTAVVN